VYHDAAVHNVTIVGGSARTVGAAGGYLTGGGHSPFAHFYGLAADNLLEARIVTPYGEGKILNQYTDPEYFWAIRGGGGSSWGVLTSVTYKTHPLPTHIQAVILQFNATNSTLLRKVHQRAFAALPGVAEAGYTGYADSDGTFQAIFSQANGTNETFARAFAPFLEMTKMEGVSGQVVPIPFSTWLDYAQYFLRDPNIATNIIDASRLLTADVLLYKTNELADLAAQFPELSPGFNFIGAVNPAERGNTAVHPVWEGSRALFSFSANWSDDATNAEKKRKKEMLVEMSKRLGSIVGKDSGTYLNEANP
jgi:FAD/FMN-containing dehydrogenase